MIVVRANPSSFSIYFFTINIGKIMVENEFGQQVSFYDFEENSCWFEGRTKTLLIDENLFENDIALTLISNLTRSNQWISKNLKDTTLF